METTTTKTMMARSVKRGTLRAVLLLLCIILIGAAAGRASAQSTDPQRYFPQTGYHIANDSIWEYFQARGGIDTFGYPVSNVFQFRGFPVQLFQRHVIQVVGDEARPVNLLDPELMPITRYNGSSFPDHNAVVASEAPAPDIPQYGQAVQQHLEEIVSNRWNGERVGFLDYFYAAAPDGTTGNDTLLALEVWGFPTSMPARDPNNDNFIYQRFQRGIMHYDASSGTTRGILLGDAFKSLLTGENLPADMENDLSESPFLRLYDPEDLQGLARTVPSVNPAVTRQNTDLSNAFTASESNPTASSANIPVALQTVADGLVAPLYLTSVPDGSGRLFVVDQIGLIHVIDEQGNLLPEPFLDVRDRMVGLNSSYDERGLLGLAFHPQYEENGRFFVYYSAPLRPGAPLSWDHTSHLSEFRVSTDNPNRANPGSERILMHINQPQANHNGGMVAFGSDGYLYLSLGDGGGANDTGIGHPPVGNGQDRTTLLGSLLRIDVDGGVPYAIPTDNPFVGQPGADEVYAYGFRNPYRFSWDRETGTLYAADVGQNLYEEVNRVTMGGNYGWNIKEGTHCFAPSTPSEPPAGCANRGPWNEPLIDPILEYPHAGQTEPTGLAVVGGYLYRGDSIPGLHGLYLFGDWSEDVSQPRGQLMVAIPQAEGPWPLQPLTLQGAVNGELDHFVLGFGEDDAGEVYVLGSQATGPSGTTGKVFKLVPAH